MKSFRSCDKTKTEPNKPKKNNIGDQNCDSLTIDAVSGCSDCSGGGGGSSIKGCSR